MTAQASDGMRYRDHDYSIAGKNGVGLFEPPEHGIKPIGTCSACWRGFVCTYAVVGGGLVLDQLAVNTEGPPPVLFGVAPLPKKRKFQMFDAIYEGLQHPVAYTGGMLIAKGFINELYVHMGFHPAWKYEEVHELIFQEGKLVEEADRSAQIAKFRDEIKDRPLEPGLQANRTDVGRWIKQCFSQDYKW